MLKGPIVVNVHLLEYINVHLFYSKFILLIPYFYGYGSNSENRNSESLKDSINITNRRNTSELGGYKTSNDEPEAEN